MIKFHSRFFCFVCGILLALFASLALMSMIPQQAYAQGSDLQAVAFEGTSKAEMPGVAAREITNSALESVARDQALEALGRDRFNANKVLIEKQIVKQASRFIPFANASEPVQQPDGSWKASVQLKTSRSSLLKMLSDAGLGGRGVVTTANVLPLIAITDRTKVVTLRWWMGEESGAEQKHLLPYLKLFHDKLSEEFAQQKISFVMPPAPGAKLPDIVRTEKPSAVEYTAIGNYFKAAMIARGDVRFMASKEASGGGQVAIRIVVIEAASPDRVVAEISREFTVDPMAASFDAGIRAKAPAEFSALAKDLASQVQVAWQRGLVGTNYMRLAVRGQLNPIQQADFKNALQRSVHEVKDVKERIFDRGQVTYEIDYAGDAAQFANRFKSLQLPGFDVRLAQVEGAGSSITVNVKPGS